MSEFRRIEKYIVINKNDVMDYLNEREFAALELTLSAIRNGRREEGKEKKNYVCVSDKNSEQFEAAWSIVDGTYANLAQENQRLASDMKGAIDLMSPSWQHAATKEPDLMTRYVTMAENQLKKKSEEIDRLTAIAAKHATRSDDLWEALERICSYLSEDGLITTGLAKEIVNAQRVLDKSRTEAEQDDA